MNIFVSALFSFIGAFVGAYVANKGMARCNAALYDQNKE